MKKIIKHRKKIINIGFVFFLIFGVLMYLYAFDPAIFTGLNQMTLRGIGYGVLALMVLYLCFYVYIFVNEPKILKYENNLMFDKKEDNEGENKE